MTIRFADTPFAKEIKSLYDGGFMTSFSIGFVPTEHRIIDDEETKEPTLVWTKWNLLEVSAVPIPSNSFAQIIHSAEERGYDMAHVKSMLDQATPAAQAKGQEAGEQRRVTVQPISLENTEPKEGVMPEETKSQEVDREALKKQLREEIEAEQKKAEEAAEAERKQKELEEKAAKAEEVEKELTNLKQQFSMGEFSKGARIQVGHPAEYNGMNLNRAKAAFGESFSKRFGGDQTAMGQKVARMAQSDATAQILACIHDAQQQTLKMPGVKVPVLKDLTNASAVGDILTPDDQRQEIINYARLTSVAMRNARVESMASDYQTFPVEGTKASVSFSAQTAEARDNDPTFTELGVTAKDLDGYVPVQQHVEMDSPNPIASILLEQFIESMGQEVDSAVFMTDGDPVSGIFLAYGRSETFSSGSTAFSNLLIDNVVNAVGKLEVPRRRNARWYAGRSVVWTNFMNLQDEDGRPYFHMNPAEAVPGRMYGYPVEEIEVGDHSTGAGKAMAVFGDLTGMIVGERLNNMTLFRDPYSLSTKHYVLYVFWTRMGFGLALPNNFVAIQTAAT
jgi:HK97 family phage major capsid protein